MSRLHPIKDRIILTNLKVGMRKLGNVILHDDNGKDDGIRPRWAEVHAVGPDQNDVSVGDWVLMEHGRWTYGQDYICDAVLTRIWMADPSGVLGISSNGKPEHIAVELPIVDSGDSLSSFI